MKTVAVVHYDEIALKGANRKDFEERLVHNIAKKLAKEKISLTMENRWGRIVAAGEEETEWSEETIQTIRRILATTPGVTVFGIGYSTVSDDEHIRGALTHLVKRLPRNFETFRVTTTRIDKNYPSTSQDMDKDLGALVFEALDSEKKVKLVNPDVTLRVEVLTDTTYVYAKEVGISGLPVGSSGKAVALLSGGFDSPVATFLCATRGVEPVLVHFHAHPHTSRAAIEKVEELARVLGSVCGPLTLILVPFLDAQKEVALTGAPEKLRVVLYRRLMMQAAERIAQHYKAKAIITGESVGQVASQTLENIAAVEAATTLPVLRPLSGMHKRDIINKAHEIGTHDISVLPHDDTCTVFMPKRPETKARLEDVLSAEKNYDPEKLVAHMLENIEVHKL